MRAQADSANYFGKDHHNCGCPELDRREGQKLASIVLKVWPLQRSVPPTILWRHTVKEAARRTAKGLASDDQVRSDTRSWTEVPFGQAHPIEQQEPWDTAIPVPIESTGLVFGGRIDRVDIRATGDGARITDYKS